jgi:hypothetical protein
MIEVIEERKRKTSQKRYTNNRGKKEKYFIDANALKQMSMNLKQLHDDIM